MSNDGWKPTEPRFEDVTGTDVSRDDWEAMIPAQRAVASVVGAVRRHRFNPLTDAELVRVLTTAAHGEFVPDQRPDQGLYGALWGVLDTTDRNPYLDALLWDNDTQALSFVPVGGLRCTNLWFKPDGEISVESNNTPAAGPNGRVLWQQDSVHASVLLQ